MLRIAAKTDQERERVKEIIRAVERARGRRLYCFYQDMRRSVDETIDHDAVVETRRNLQEVGHLDKLSILIESPGGNIDSSFRLARTLRRYADDVEAIVVNWAKSGATFLCLSANSLVMSYDGEIGPLDTQIADPRGGRSISALNAFKSLEFLREHILEALEMLVRYYVEEHNMSLPHAVKSAEPLVSDVVAPLFAQIDPLELGEARRYLALGEHYTRIAMERYSYSHLSRNTRENLIRKLVWSYPSHGVMIDRQEAKRIGLNVIDLDDATSDLLEEMLATAKGCIGMATDEPAAGNPPAHEEQIDLTAENEATEATEAAPR